MLFGDQIILLFLIMKLTVKKRKMKKILHKNNKIRLSNKIQNNLKKKLCNLEEGTQIFRLYLKHKGNKMKLVQENFKRMKNLILKNLIKLIKNKINKVKMTINLKEVVQDIIVKKTSKSLRNKKNHFSEEGRKIKNKCKRKNKNKKLRFLKIIIIILIKIIRTNRTPKN